MNDHDKDTLIHLSALNARFIENYVTNDVASHDAILHPLFSYISGSGSRLGRADYLQAWATGFDPAVIPYWDLRDEHILLHGKLALVSAANRYVEVVDGREQVGMAAYTDTYVCDDGMWLCIQAQITPISRPHWPPDDTILSVYLNGIRS